MQASAAGQLEELRREKEISTGASPAPLTRASRVLWLFIWGESMNPGIRTAISQFITSFKSLFQEHFISSVLCTIIYCFLPVGSEFIYFFTLPIDLLFIRCATLIFKYVDFFQPDKHLIQDSYWETPYS